jgi:hypothetical protein
VIWRVLLAQLVTGTAPRTATANVENSLRDCQIETEPGCPFFILRHCRKRSCLANCPLRLGTFVRMLPMIAALAKRRASSLSGGQPKIVALGRVLMSDTQLLLLDEPFERDDYANGRGVVIQEATALTGSRASAPAYIRSAPFTAAPGTTLCPIFARTDSMA